MFGSRHMKGNEKTQRLWLPTRVEENVYGFLYLETLLSLYRTSPSARENIIHFLQKSATVLNTATNCKDALSLAFQYTQRLKRLVLENEGGESTKIAHIIAKNFFTFEELEYSGGGNHPLSLDVWFALRECEKLTHLDTTGVYLRELRNHKHLLGQLIAKHGSGLTKLVLDTSTFDFFFSSSSPEAVIEQTLQLPHALETLTIRHTDPERHLVHIHSFPLATTLRNFALYVPKLTDNVCQQVAVILPSLKVLETINVYSSSFSFSDCTVTTTTTSTAPVWRSASVTACTIQPNGYKTAEFQLYVEMSALRNFQGTLTPMAFAQLWSSSPQLETISIFLKPEVTSQERALLCTMMSSSLFASTSPLINTTTTTTTTTINDNTERKKLRSLIVHERNKEELFWDASLCRTLMDSCPHLVEVDINIKFLRFLNRSYTRFVQDLLTHYRSTLETCRLNSDGDVKPYMITEDEEKEDDENKDIDPTTTTTTTTTIVLPCLKFIHIPVWNQKLVNVLRLPAVTSLTLLHTDKIKDNEIDITPLLPSLVACTSLSLSSKTAARVRSRLFSLMQKEDHRQHRREEEDEEEEKKQYQALLLLKSVTLQSCTQHSLTSFFSWLPNITVLSVSFLQSDPLHLCELTLASLSIVALSPLCTFERVTDFVLDKSERDLRETIFDLVMLLPALTSMCVDNFRSSPIRF